MYVVTCDDAISLEERILVNGSGRFAPPWMGPEIRKLTPSLVHFCGVADSVASRVLSMSPTVVLSGTECRSRDQATCAFPPPFPTLRHAVFREASFVVNVKFAVKTATYKEWNRRPDIKEAHPCSTAPALPSRTTVLLST